MSLSPSNFIAPLAIVIVVLFGVFAVVATHYLAKQGKIKDTTEYFLTARNSQPWYRVAWGFYATTIGAGVIFAVPGFVVAEGYGAGYIGLITYSIFSGLPFFLVAYLGTKIKKRFPSVLSIGSFSGWRFGKAFQTWVTLNVLFNLGIAMSVEYTAIGNLFSQYLDLPSWVPILVVAIVTMAYTAAGGLYISLFTDQVQCLFIFALLAAMGIFVCINFRTGTLPSELPPQLQANYYGWSSIATLGIALVSSTLFSDAVWQRVWSAKDDRTLMKGAGAGFVLVTIVTFLFGFGGFVAAWAGLVTDPNVAFLELLKIGEDRVIPLGMLTLVIVMAAVMNESAVDSFQIAIGDTIVSFGQDLGLDISITMCRLLLVFINVPFAIIGSQGYNVVSLYLITNLFTTCLMLPLACGMIPKLDRVVTGGAALFGSFFGLISIVFYAVTNQINSVNGGYVADWADFWVNFGEGIKTTFYVVYDWPQFIIGLVGSVVGMLIYIGLEYLHYRVTGKTRPTPSHLETQAPTAVPSLTVTNEDGEISEPKIVQVEA